MDLLVENMKKIVKECGAMILSKDESSVEVSYKEGICNVVTSYDIKIQTYLKDNLLELVPSATFVGEEEDCSQDILEHGYTFIVDPIDGTTNFLRNIPLSAVSVALLKDGDPYIAICYYPYRDEMFWAKKGSGAYLNGKRISVSSKKLQDGLFLSGNSPYYSNLRSKTLELQQKFILASGDYRRFGSAVLELCLIACGRAEVYAELKLQPWDYAAASLIVLEAGGVVSTLEGDKVSFTSPSSILASNGQENYLNLILNEK